jgi:hypothetical protein
VTKLLRPNQIFGQSNPLPIGKTRFFQDFVHREGGDDVQYIPGTDIPRLKLVRLSARSVAALEDEVEALIGAWRDARDARRPFAVRKASKRHSPEATT